jgi:hypothetical protein
MCIYVNNLVQVKADKKLCYFAITVCGTSVLQSIVLRTEIVYTTTHPLKVD